MQQITYINKEDLDNLEQNPDGTYKVPEGFVIYLKSDQTKIENIQAEIARIEAQIEPTYKELIEWGRINHSYYHDRQMLVFLRDELNDLQNGN